MLIKNSVSFHPDFNSGMFRSWQNQTRMLQDKETDVEKDTSTMMVIMMSV